MVDFPTGEPYRTEFQVIETIKGNPGLRLSSMNHPETRAEVVFSLVNII
jgi:hypothetical protein